ncbi:MAG: alpha/beta fold hydrolase [Promethearchaeota archaeon]|jgi:pimeloyl-ACP methyl ester carboxylesterase
MSTEIFNLGNVQIEGIVNGTGDIIVLLAGLGGEASTYDEFTPFLNKAGYKTIAINLRGIAGSKGPLEDITLHDLANDVAGVIKSLSKNPVHVGGWAFGNRVARCLAEDHPQLVKTLTLLAAGGRATPDPEAMKNLGKLFNTNLPNKERMEAARLSLFSPSTDADTVYRAMRGGRSWPIATSAHSKANQITSVMEWWNGGTAPMLVIQGRDDLIAVPENGEILKKDNGERVTLVNIENAGHSLVREKPNQIADEMISFFSNFQ